MSEVVRTFVCAEARHEEADSAAKAPLRTLGGFAQIGLELAEGHLDRIEIGRVLGQISQCMARPRSASRLFQEVPSSLLQCIRPMSFCPGHDGDPHTPVLINQAACLTAI